jgi:NAD(P)-dependent dehydrogenase (short-subunit alcohol dehydrogenase family)
MMPLPSFRLDGNVAIVTGGTGVLGMLAAKAFAAAGANIVLADIIEKSTLVEELEQTGRRVLSLRCDVSDPASVDHMVKEVATVFGRIDILFNNAGVISSKRLIDVEEGEWDRVIDVSAKGTWLCGRAVARTMMEAGHGKIINMSSIAASRGMQDRGPYCAAKAAVTSLTRTMAVEFGPAGLNVNAIAPTAIITDLNRHLLKTQPEVYDSVLRRTPLGRLAEPEDISGALVFLASPAARYITGQVLHVDGGFSAT